MAYTQTDLDNIKAAIASGELRVRLQDKEVEYRTLKDMLLIKQLIEDELSGDDNMLLQRVPMLTSKGVR